MIQKGVVVLVVEEEEEEKIAQSGILATVVFVQEVQ